MNNLKHKIRDFCIWLIVISGAAFVYRKQVAKKGPLVRVLCFHDVPDRAWFEKVIEMLSKRYNIISPEQFQTKDFDTQKINILLTFDDGYQSWLDVAMPVLSHFNIKGLFFISSGLLDAAEEGEEMVKHFVCGRLRLTQPRQALTWDGAQIIIEAGHTIGGHTVTHVSLGELSRERVSKEIVSDKSSIEERLHVTLYDFAYPFGRNIDLNPVAQEVVNENEYEHTFSAITGFYNGDLFEQHNSFQPISRTLIEENQSPKKIRYWVEGGCDIFKQLISVAR